MSYIKIICEGCLVYLKNNVSMFYFSWHLEFGYYMTMKYISEIITQR